MADEVKLCTVFRDDLATSIFSEIYVHMPIPPTYSPSQAVAKPERISRLEIAKVLRERNEWKEKYFSLLEQVR